MIFYFIIIIVFVLSLPAYGLLLEKCIYDYISGKYGNTCALQCKISVFCHVCGDLTMMSMND